MSIDGGPDIIKDGLVLCLDAGNRNSYKSGSNTWFDLSVNNNNSGSLINGPTFNSANGGSIVFDGTNDYIGNFPVQISGTGSKTIGVWFRTTTIVRNGLCGIRPSVGSQGWAFIVNGAAYGNLTYYHTGGSTLQVSAGIVTGSWYYGCAAYNQTAQTATLHLNGQQIGASSSFSTISGSSFNGIIGNEQQSNSIEYFKGDIPTVQIYNRALSAAEVLQNYNANKGRFGL
jgi:hypothetical protein